ncbi:superoxide dismutase family protein [Virgibacillus dakarensis]|uniref:superoxide dismutase family protein n=1 Tax=Virgibacillus dakarensis TaxID=1917889 RepID=UPI000B44CB43|nr:superoxide dismutase family protein [Virgibacillus dakarensis]
MKRWAFLLLLLTIMLVITACGGNADDESNSQDNTGGADDNTQNEKKDDDNQTVQVDLKNGDGESVGTTTLEQVSKGVKITLEGHDIPSGTHGFHIHETGQCEEPDFKSAGGHFNPEDSNHGFDDPDGLHAGDLPNIVVGKDGTVNESFIAEKVTLEEGKDNSLFGDGGTAIVIHEGADDGKSQPSGDAGDRFACGAINK